MFCGRVRERRGQGSLLAGHGRGSLATWQGKRRVCGQVRPSVCDHDARPRCVANRWDQEVGQKGPLLAWHGRRGLDGVGVWLKKTVWVGSK
jgi:hypothetical protein